MATKYARESPLGEDRTTPYRSLPSPIPGRNRRLWMYFCYVALALCLGLAPFLSPNLFQTTFFRPPLHQGEAAIVRKVEAAEGGNRAVEIAIALPAGRETRLVVPFPEPYWSPIQPGDRIAVRYRLLADGAGIADLEPGLVALPPPLR